MTRWITEAISQLAVSLCCPISPDLWLSESYCMRRGNKWCRSTVPDLSPQVFVHLLVLSASHIGTWHQSFFRLTDPQQSHAVQTHSQVGPHRNKCSPAFTLTAVVYVVRKPCDNSYIYTMGWIKSFLFFKLVKFAPMIWVCFSGKFTSVNIIIMKKRSGKKQRKKDLKVRKRELFRDKDPHKRHKNIII